MSTNDQNDATMPVGAPEEVTRLTEPPDALGATPTQPLLAALIKGRYQVERELGRGGIGVVYLARDLQLMSRPVVIKVLLEASAQNEWFKKKFNQEMEALARLDHPGIVAVLDAGQTQDGKPYLVMQYIEGRVLREVIRERRVDLPRVARIIRQVGQALSAAHDKGINHRDLKPENIMLQRLGEDDEQVKLIDFGIATVKDSETATNRETTTVAGTAAYMAPEQLLGKPVAASDIYAMAVIAYEMVAGCRPFNPESPYQLLGMQEAGVQVKPCELCGDLSEAAQDAILKSLAFDSEQRHARARDFGEELAQALMATGTSPARRTRPISEADAAATTPAQPDAATARVAGARLTQPNEGLYAEPAAVAEPRKATPRTNAMTQVPEVAPVVASVTNRSRFYLAAAAAVLIAIAAVVAYTRFMRGSATPPAPLSASAAPAAPAPAPALPLATAEFYDEFLNLTRWTVPPAGWMITRQNRLLIESQPLIGSPTGINCENFTMTFHLRLENAGGAAWALHAKDPNNYYLFYLSGPDGQIPNRFLTYVVRDNKFTPPEFKSSIPVVPRLASGGEYQIDIKVDKNRFFHWITPSDSGKKFNLGDYTDTDNVFPAGGVGFRTIGIEKFSMDDLFIWPPGTEPPH